MNGNSIAKIKSTAGEIAAWFKNFELAFVRGVEGFIEAGHIYVEAIDADPENAERFKQHFADKIPSAVWGNLEAIGRKWIRPEVAMGLIADRGLARKIKRLPYSTQTMVIEQKHRWPFLLANGDTMLLSLLDATPEQAEQLCNGSEIRDIPQQKAWLESRKAREQVAAAEDMPYIIAGNRVTFKRGFVATKSELRRILSEM